MGEIIEVAKLFKKNYNVYMGEKTEMDPSLKAISALKKAAEAADSGVAQTVIDKISGFKISRWKAQGKLVQQEILESWRLAQKNGVDSIAAGAELRQAANVINVAAKTAEYIDQDKEYNVNIENDFFWNTVDHAKNVSDESVQDILAKILAGEYNQEGSYNMHTLQVVKNLDNKLLNMFMDVSNQCISGGMIPEELYSLECDLKPRPSYESLQTLQTLGLILPNASSQKTNKVKNITISYQNKSLRFETENPSDDTVLIPNFYSLSNVGIKIDKLLEKRFNEDYYKWLKKNYKIPGYKLISK